MNMLSFNPIYHSYLVYKTVSLMFKLTLRKLYLCFLFILIKLTDREICMDSFIKCECDNYQSIGSESFKDCTKKKMKVSTKSKNALVTKFTMFPELKKINIR